MESEVVTSEQSAEVTEPEVSEQSAETQVEEPAKVEGEAEVVPSAPQPRKHTAQERIDEITKARREAEREAEFWKNKALQVQVQKPAETPTPVIARPMLSQFATTEDYEDALFAWNDKVNEAKHSVRAQQESEVRAERDYNERVQKIKQEYPDYDDVVNSAPVFTPIMRQAIYDYDSDNGAVLAYNLALPENRDTAIRIGKLSPVKQLVELGKFEAQTILAKQANKKTNAPPPIKPLGSTAGGEVIKDTSKMSDEDYYKYDESKKREELLRKLKSLGG